MLISIVTVCFNAEKTIQATMESVCAQKHCDFEYLIVDGKSTDNTVDIINHISEKIENNRIQFKLISEKDTGIYNAMNKAIDIAKGDWILYMNSGDRFCSNEVLEEIAEKLTFDYDFIYGNAIYCDKDKSYIVKGKDITYIRKSMPFCHQAIFAQKKILKRYRFNEKYKICADYDLFCRAYLDNRKYLYMDYDICVYNLDGFSGNNVKKCIQERTQIRKEKGFIGNVHLCFVNEYFRSVASEIIKRMVPQRVVCWIRTLKYK